MVKPHARNQSNNNDLDNNAFNYDLEYTLEKLLYFLKHKTLTLYCILINCKDRGGIKWPNRKIRGGLGLQTAKGRNIALLAKLNRRLYTKKDALWAKVLGAKYCTSRRCNSSNADKLPCSRIWTAIKKGREVFMKGSRWTVGKDSKINFYGNWTKQGPIRQLIQGPLTWEASMLEIKDVIQDSGWDWNKLPFEFPLDCKLMLQAIPVSRQGRGSDRLAWVENPKGIFDLKSAYGIAMGDDTNLPFTTNWIWKLATLPRVKFFSVEVCP